MSTPRFCCFLLTVGLFAQSERPAVGADNAPSFEPIFDGKSFAGWRHDDSHWRVEDGAIVGEIPAGETLRRNLFLFWKGEVHDFELRLEFRVTGHPSANSGVQFRSQVRPDGGAAGYQADIDDGAVWLGRIYDEHGRGLIAERGAEVVISADGERKSESFRKPEFYRTLVRDDDWNDYVIRAVGPRMETTINGERATVLIDHQRGQQDFSGKLALQLHSGPGPAKIEFRQVALKRIGKTELPEIPRAEIAQRKRSGVIPVNAAGEPLNLGLEKGTLEGWKARGEAWREQPIRGDTVRPRRSDQASEHVGEYWIGGYERHGDGPRGVLESAPFEVTHPWASYLIGGGPHAETRVEIVAEKNGEVLHSARGQQRENLSPVIVDLRRHRGEKIFVRIVDEHSGGWGHVNYDDFRFHESVPQAVREASVPRRVRENPILQHLEPNPADAAAEASPAASTVANFHVEKGFRVDLIASEPAVRQPIAFTIDARGRLWVVEAFSYPQRQPEGEGRDRVTIFADDDADGRFETRKVFIEGLNLASGIEIGFGGVWIGAAPYLLFIPDADRDDVPDGEPEVLLDGFGYQDTHETLNSFTWGPDGWLYGNQGVFNRSRIGKPGASPDERSTLYAGVWRFHPVRGRFEVFARGGSNQWGLDFDARGELFMTHCRSYWGGGPTTHVVRHGHYWNQANSRHAPFVSGDHPPGLPHLRNFLLASARYGHGEGGAGKRGSRAIYGGHSHVGTMIYLGDNWPSSYRGDLYTHNLHGHQINRQTNVRSGSGFDTRHAGRDLAYVEDPRYIAVDLDYGPDGSVYIIDWYDRQHCHSPNMERWDRSDGRIYRMAFAQGFQPRKVDLASESDVELARRHAHPNAWFARTARRLLQERAARGGVSADAVGVLRKLLEGEGGRVEPAGVESAVLSLRALWTLHVAGELRAADLEAQLQRDDEALRAWAVRLGTQGKSRARLAGERLVELAQTDASARVRLALASALPDLDAPLAWRVASALSQHGEDAGDRMLPRMIWYGIAPCVPADLDRAFAFAGDARLPVLRDYVTWYAARTAEGRARLLGGLQEVDVAEQERRLNLVAFALRRTGGATAPPVWRELASTLYDHENRTIRRLAEDLGAAFEDEELLRRMRAILELRDAAPARREQAFEVLSRAGDERAVPAFIELLDDPKYRSRVIPVLARSSREGIAAALLDRFDDFSQEDQRRTILALIRRADLARPFLRAVLAGEIDRGQLTSFHVRQLRNLGDARVNELVAEGWGQVRETSEESRKRLERYLTMFREAPLWAYETHAGKQTYEKVCGTCHTLGGEGGQLGPDLTGAGRNGVEYFLESILDPNAVVGEDYQSTLVITRDGSVLSGLLTDENEQAITLRQVDMDDAQVIQRADILEMEKQEVSFMPEGLLDTLSDRQVIELLKYLLSSR